MRPHPPSVSIYKQLMVAGGGKTVVFKVCDYEQGAPGSNLAETHWAIKK